VVILRAFLYLVAGGLVVLAAFGIGGRVSLALLGAALFILAFGLDDIVAGFH
jgi:hypothetical protein